MTFCPNEKAFIAGDFSRVGYIAILIGAMFKYLHFNHLAFYLFNTFLSATGVIVFFKLARTCLNKKLSLYLTAIFAFNPETFYYNNFVLKETILVLMIIAVMYLFFKALATNLPRYKVLFCLALPLIPFVRASLYCIGLMPFAFAPKRIRRIFILPAIIVLFTIMCLSKCPHIDVFERYWRTPTGDYGMTKTVSENVFGVETAITFGEIYSSPSLMVRYLTQSFLCYIRPGMKEGVKLNSVLIPYTLFTVFVFIASLRYRKFLMPIDRTVYLLIALIIILVSLILIIYDPIERYRYNVFQLVFMLLILNFKGYQRSNFSSVTSDNNRIESHC